MNELVFSLRSELPQRLDASPLLPEQLATLSLSDIMRLPLHFESGERIKVGELCTVEGTPSDHVRLTGDWSFADGIGAGLTHGTIRVEGSVGRRTGFRMSGGSVEVAGDADEGTGLEMSYGQIIVRGSTGSRTGSAMPGAKRGMTGGEIIIFGDAGSETGAYMRRGIIAVAGSVGPSAAQSAIAGTLVSIGDIVSPAGRWSKRASIIALSTVPILPTYAYACTFKPSFVRLLLTYLRRTYDFPVTHAHADGLFDRYCGDLAESTRGEILQWVGE